jgi:hypothetical protein
MNRIDAPLLLTLRPKHGTLAEGFFDENLVRVHGGTVAIGIEDSLASEFFNTRILSGQPLTEDNVIDWLHQTYQEAYARHLQHFPLILAAGTGEFAEGRQWINEHIFGLFNQNQY